MRGSGEEDWRIEKDRDRGVYGYRVSERWESG